MYFDRDDVALPNFSSFFLERSVKEREQAEKLLEYQNMRGGRVLLQTIAVNETFSVIYLRGGGEASLNYLSWDFNALFVLFIVNMLY